MSEQEPTIQTVHNVRDDSVNAALTPQKIILNITRKQYAALNQLDSDDLILFQQAFNVIVSLATKGNV